MTVLPDGGVDRPGIDPLLEWNFVGDGTRLQLRFPDGRHITFDHDVERVAQCLESLAAGQYHTDDVAHALIDLLGQRRAFSSLSDAGADWALDVYDHAFRLAKRRSDVTASDIDVARRVPIAVLGEGWLCDQVLAAIDALGMNCTRGLDALADGALLVVASDQFDPDLFSQGNARAVSVGAKALFVHRELGCLVMGPFVIPGQTACFDCYRERLRAVTRHKDEFDSRAMAAAEGRSVRRAPSRILAGLSQSLLATHVLAAAAGAYDLFDPGSIVSFDVVSMKKMRQPVLKMPRCPTCSIAGTHPPRAIRTIA